MKKNALIVDDSRLACKVMANMLETIGIKSFAVYSAEEALEYLQHNQPDIIFLDHTMPGMDGLETIKVIKSNPLTATVPVMMYTAKQGDVYVGQARALGAVDVLPKGLEKDYLFKALEKLGLVEFEQKEPSVQEAVEKTEKVVEVPVKKVEYVQEKPGWQSFWQQKAEPYLNRQKSQHIEEFQRYTNLQTRKLTREFHQTLEHFEHAMVHRMESHDEFVEAREELSKSFYKKVSIGVGAISLFLLFGIFWQLWQVNQQNTILLEFQKESYAWRENIEDQFLLLNDRFSSLESAPKISSQQSNGAMGFNNVALLDENGTVISDLLPMDLEKGLFTGKTDAGYKFVVNSQGELGWPLEKRYYLTETCEGDAFVNSPSGTILKEANGTLWYVDKLSPTMLMTVNSQRTETDECVPLKGEVLNLNRLLANQSLETGIDGLQTTEIFFSR
ncbi:response regulator [Aliikangiella sp. IMCC44359]|uniref:response regulator n=1 Tax=Aliikangiella sp. IMCC44359 TaxID=3459125 RepID=UPI00403B2B22